VPLKICSSDARLEVFTVMKIQNVLFLIVTPSSDVAGYQRFTQKMETA